MNKFLLCLCIYSLFSCEKICKVTTVFCKENTQQEPEKIDFTLIDVFPAFKECNSKLTYSESKTCFETTLHQKISDKIQDLQLSSENPIIDTLLIRFSISKKGKFTCKNIKLTPPLNTSFPYLTEDIQSIVENLTKVSPAQKRGIPVVSTYTIPLVIKTE